MDAGELRHTITFQKLDDDTEKWIDYYTCRAKANININKGNETFDGGVEQSKTDVIFSIRYCKTLEDLFMNAQSYRIIFYNGIFCIMDVDNFMFKNETLNIKAVGKHER